MNLALKHLAIFLVYFLAQVFIFNHFSILDMASAHIFLVALLVLPVNTPFSIQILIGFVAGMLVDVFSVGAFLGLHAFSAVLMMALRTLWVFTFTNRINFKGNESHLVQIQPLIWQVQYMLPLILLYETCYQLLEVFSFDQFGTTAIKIVGSTLFSFAMALILITLIHRDTRR